ncbi:ketoacyl-synt-domain-containing protein [Rickenella mellea]|uniref:Ketoacyl-synt-domain-containing protein n=1 Tax=Rickenella mellea TaxID=50990 RepID=A0A4Y7PM95_9AGAM|nr:ketoacyl-synt-domain-containing protein [Rickenella mellea]
MSAARNVRRGRGGARVDGEARMEVVLTMIRCWWCSEAVVERDGSDASEEAGDKSAVFIAPTQIGVVADHLPDDHLIPDSTVSISVDDFSSFTILRPRVENVPIAIIGQAFKFPGANNEDELWSILEQGLNTVSEIPNTRFEVSPYTSKPPSNPGRILKTLYGNFISDVDAAGFDAAFFKISPRGAKSMDPQQRVLLQVSYHALENYWVLCRMATNDYVQNLRQDVDVHYSTGTLPAFLSGRISYALGLSGPSLVVNTTCSSSLVAIYQACRAIAADDCTAALAGGVNIITSPDMYLGLDRAHFLSPTGQCKPFDESADGYCRADDCGMFVLKRLEDAIAENDNILGVIRGIEVNQSGLATSITQPHHPTQAKLFKTLLSDAGLHPHEVSVVEAHGTGTQGGDPAELRSLRQVLCSGRTMENPLYVSAIKANLGHAGAASGAAGLAKLLLMLDKQFVPPQISLRRLNPKIELLGKDGTVISAVGVPWPMSGNGGRRRIALLNNFGAAGSNAALLIEEPPVSLRSIAREDSKAKVLVAFCADSEPSLLKIREQYVAHVEGSALRDRQALVDFGYTVTARRQVGSWRVAVFADSAEELGQQLRVAKPSKVASENGTTVFIFFSGQGGQYLGMGQSLYATSKIFRDSVNECHEMLVSWGYPGVLSVINPQGELLFDMDDEIVAFQCAIFVLDLGEYAALVAAHVLSVDSALRLVAYRANLMVRRCEMGVSGMMALRLGPQMPSKILEDGKEFDMLSMPCFNTSASAVVGGPLDQLSALQVHLETAGTCKCVHLEAPFAFHTVAMDPILEDFTAYAAKFHFSPPDIPIGSNVHGRIIDAGDDSVFGFTYLVQHARHPVFFESIVDSLLRTIDVEACAPAGSILSTSLARLYQTRRDLNWRQPTHSLHLPTGSRSVKSNQTWLLRRPIPPNTHFLESWTKRPSTRDANMSEFETSLEKLATFVSGHVVFDYALCPAAVYHELAIAAATCTMDYAYDRLTLCQRKDTAQDPSNYGPSLYQFQTAAAQSDGSPPETLRTWTIYHLIFSRVVQYSSTFQAIRSLTLSTNGGEACAIIKLPEDHDSGMFVAHPVFVDTLTHLAGFVVDREVPSDQLYICSQSDSTKVLSDLLDYDMNYDFICSTIPVADGVVLADAWAVETATPNRVVAHIKRMRFSRVRPSSLKKLLSGSQTLFHTEQSSATDQSQAPVARRRLRSRTLSSSSTITIVEQPADVANDVLKLVSEVCGTTSAKITLSSKISDLGLDYFMWGQLTGELQRTFPSFSLDASQLQSSYTLSDLADLVSRSQWNEKAANSPDGIIEKADFRTVITSQAKVSFSEQSHRDESPELHETAHPRRTSGERVTFVPDVSLGTDSPLTLQVKEILGNVLDIPAGELHDEHEVVQLWLDSLASIEALHNLQVQFRRHPELSDYAQATKTIYSFDESFRVYCSVIPECEFLEKVFGFDQTLIQVQTANDGDGVPLFLVHDGSGMTSGYTRIGALGRAVWSINNPKLLSGEHWVGGIPEMAGHYINEISAALTHDGWILGGWSFGGIVAFHMACEMQRAGIKVAGVILIDSPSPFSTEPLPPVLIDAVLPTAEFSNVRHARIASLVRTQMNHSTHAVVAYEPQSAPRPYPRLVMVRCTEAFDVSAVPGCGALTFLTDRRDPRSAVEDWERLVGGTVEVLDIPGHHFEPFHPKHLCTIQVMGLTEQLQNAISLLTS